MNPGPQSPDPNPPLFGANLPGVGELVHVQVKKPMHGAYATDNHHSLLREASQSFTRIRPSAVWACGFRPQLQAGLSLGKTHFQSFIIVRKAVVPICALDQSFSLALRCNGSRTFWVESPDTARDCVAYSIRAVSWLSATKAEREGFKGVGSLRGATGQSF